MTDRNERGLSRRTFLKASGVATGVASIAPGAAGTAAASEEPRTEDFLAFTNPRVRRAANAWQRGYRGRADRTLALTDSGTDSRHPDIGPWNGVVARSRGGYETFRYDYPEDTSTTPVTDDDGDPVTETFSGVSHPGSHAAGDEYALAVPEGTERITLELSVTPSVDVAGQAHTEDELEVQVDLNEGDVAAVAALRTETDRVAKHDLVDAGEEYTVFVGSAYGAGAYDLTVGYHEFVKRQPRRVPVDDPMAGLGRDDEPALVGWNNDSPRYHYSRAPRDRNSHGTHCAGIMASSGQACAIDLDHDDTRIEEPRTVLLPGDVLSYEVEAEAGTGVFASAYGDGIELVIEGPDGRQLRRSRGTNGTSEESLQNNTAEAPANEDGSYTVHVRATEGEAVPGRVETVAVGAFRHHAETGGDATGEDLGFHSGTCPGASVLTVTNLGVGTELLAEYADRYAADFNVRAVNMSWGYAGGAPLGAAAGLTDTTPAEIRTLAEAGILTVAAAGNAATPANGNGAPAVADEAVSVVATGPLDGIAAYSSGGVGGVDEETTQPNAKPDLAAIGGLLNDLDQSTMPGDPAEDAPHEEAEQFGSERTYSGKGGTSMASPSACGIAGLVAQAMEEDAPDPIALPEPGVADRVDVLRLKSALLATASTTAFHAAPYHRGKAPTYTPGERDSYEGHGRVNAGAAVDAVSRDLLARGFGDLETVGLGVPDDEQAVAGHVHADGEGTVSVDISFSHYAGANSGLTRGDPHVDLYVYDAVAPEGVTLGEDGAAVDGPATGDPAVVTSAQGVDGAASVEFDVAGDEVYYVVAELVNVPGAVNGLDVRAHFEADVAFDAAPLPAFTAAGDRVVDSSVSFGRDVSRVDLTVTDLDADADVVDRFPQEWTYLERFSDGELTDDGGVSFGTVPETDVEGDGQETFTYFVESSDTPEGSGPYTFGPAEATAVDDSGFRDDSAEFAGQDDVVTVGVDV